MCKEEYGRIGPAEGQVIGYEQSGVFVEEPDLTLRYSLCPLGSRSGLESKKSMEELHRPHRSIRKVAHP